MHARLDHASFAPIDHEVDASERVEELLVTAQELWRSGVEVENDDERVATFRAAIQLVNLADMVSLSTRA